ncbi:MAG: C40 family peptidase [Oscillospiraceae bacterium]
MKNNILIIVVVTLVAIGVVAAVIIAGVAKGSESSQPSSDIPDWGGSHASSGTWEGSDSSLGSTSSQNVTNSTGESSSSSSEVPSSSSSAGSSSTSSIPAVDYSAAESIVATANSLIGVPFVMGGNNPDGFDNPGFIYYVLRENGFHSCSHSIAKQSTMGRQIGYEELKAGDLVFFGVDDNTKAVFGGIYIGEGKMVACITPTNGEPGVMTSDITTPYYRRRFFCGVSLS